MRLAEHRLMLGPDQFEIDQQPAISIFGKRRQRIQADHVDTEFFQRFDQRERQPLRKLVEGYQAVGQIIGCSGGMMADVAEIDACKFDPVRPD